MPAGIQTDSKVGNASLSASIVAARNSAPCQGGEWGVGLSRTIPARSPSTGTKRTVGSHRSGPVSRGRMPPLPRLTASVPRIAQSGSNTPHRGPRRDSRRALKSWACTAAQSVHAESIDRWHQSRHCWLRSSVTCWRASRSLTYGASASCSVGGLVLRISATAGRHRPGHPRRRPARSSGIGQLHGHCDVLAPLGQCRLRGRCVRRGRGGSRVATTPWPTSVSCKAGGPNLSLRQ